MNHLRSLSNSYQILFLLGPHSNFTLLGSSHQDVYGGLKSIHSSWFPVLVFNAEYRIYSVPPLPWSSLHTPMDKSSEILLYPYDFPSKKFSLIPICHLIVQSPGHPSNL